MPARGLEGAEVLRAGAAWVEVESNVWFSILALQSGGVKSPFAQW